MTTAIAHAFQDLGGMTFRPGNGKCVITDPCYVFPDEMWSDLCERIFCREGSYPYGVIEMDGFKIWWGLTAHGDGSYRVMSKHKGPLGTFCVDAGMFGIFPLAFVEKYAPEFLARKDDGLYTIVETKEHYVTKYSDGNMECGAISVNTDDDGDEEVDD